MSKFRTTLCVTEIDDKIFQTIDHPFVYESNLLGELVTVPVGFYTDFASVPRLGLIYAALGDMAHQPAVVHDWLYYAGTTSRELSDRVLLEAMEVVGIPLWRRWPIYWGVRAGGVHAWNEHRRKGHCPNRFVEDQAPGANEGP